LTDGKHLTADAEPFHARGVTYGGFATRDDGAPYPERAQIKLDLAAMPRFSGLRVYVIRGSWRASSRQMSSVASPDPLSDTMSSKSVNVWPSSAEIAARVVDEGFNDLDAPIRRLTGAFCPTPYSPSVAGS
jgi:hypothetical protein